jgi:glycosyltransferase involved in cell wall biosynthesis
MNGFSNSVDLNVLTEGEALPPPNLSLVIPFIDTWDITSKCLQKVAENSTKDIEVWLIDNGSEQRYYDQALSILDGFNVHYVVNPVNVGVLPTFKQGLALSQSEVICFIHNDVLLQEKDWNEKVSGIFEAVPDLGLAGLFGAVGVGENGGRIRSMSKMLGVDWGKCECHEVAWQHHSEYLDGIHPATILDGVGMFFSRKALQSLVESDMFADWRAPHHFYDRIMPLKLIDKGFKIATIGTGFDHWSGATANSSQTYNDTAKAWLENRGSYDPSQPADQQIYNLAEKQFFDEFGKRLPCTVDSTWNYHWTGIA